MENEYEQQDATSPDEYAEIDQPLNGYEDPVVLKERLELASEAKRQLTARARKAEEELKALKAASKPEPAQADQAPKQPDILEDERLELRLQGYSKEEVSLIMNNGGTKILENANNPVVIGIKAVREQRKAEQAAEQATDHSGLSEVERKYTPEQLNNMTSEELKKVLPHA